MIIPINDKYRINSDSYQWFAQQYRGMVKDKNGNMVESWKSVMYYPTIDGLVRGLSQRMLRESKVDTLALALLEVESVCNTLKTALSPVFDVKRVAQ